MFRAKIAITIFGTVKFSSLSCYSACLEKKIYASVRAEGCEAWNTRCVLSNGELECCETFSFHISRQTYFTFGIHCETPIETVSSAEKFKHGCIGSIQICCRELFSRCSDSQHACLPLEISDVESGKLFLILRVAEITDDCSTVGLENFVHALAQRSSFLLDRAQCLQFRFTQNGDSKDLDSALADCTTSLDLLPRDHPLRPHTLNSLAECQLLFFEQYGDIKRLESSLSMSREAIHSRRIDHPQHLAALNNLTLALCDHFMQSGNMQHLESAVESGTEALRLCPSGQPLRASTLDNLAEARKTMYQIQGDISELELSILYHIEALQLRPVGHPDRTISLNHLAFALYTRFQKHGDRDDLELAISLSTESLAVGSEKHIQCAVAHNNLGFALWVRFRQWGDTADLDSAIHHHSEALRLRLPGHPMRYRSLRGLACALNSRFNHQGGEADLDLAIKYFYDALTLQSLVHADRCGTLNDLAIALHSRFRRTGELAELNNVISYFLEALQLRPPQHLLPNVLTNLGTMLNCRFDLIGDMTDLDSSVSYLQQSLALRPRGHTYRSTSLLNLAEVLRFRFHNRGDIADLSESLAHETEALTLRPPGHPGRALLLHNLGHGLLYRFERYGGMADLDLATLYFAESLELRDHSDPDRCRSFLSLALAMQLCFEHYGDQTDIERAILHAYEALCLRPPGHPYRPTVLSLLANLMWIKFEVGESIVSLDLSVKYSEEALAGLPNGGHSRPSAVKKLAFALRSRFDLTRRAEDLELALEHLTHTLECCSSSHGDYYELLNALSGILIARYGAFGDPADLEVALSHLISARDQLSSDHPFLHSVYRSLAHAYYVRHLSSGAQSDEEEFFRLIEKAVHHKTAGLQARLTSSLWWISAAYAQQHASLLSAYRACLSLLDQSIVLVPAVVRRHRIRKTVVPANLPSDAAACAIQKGELETAVELLEQGRSLLWAQLGRFRTSLDYLQARGERERTLAEDFERLSYLLETGGTYRADDDETPRRSADNKLQYNDLWKQWEMVVEEIRKIEGFSGFLKVLPFMKLQEAANGGPVIILNASEFRCDAIIIIMDQPPRLVPLPATMDDVSRLSLDFKSALSAATARGEEKQRSKNMIVVLRRLWALIVRPVAEELQTIVRSGSRIWWCPTSKLVSLPLHAAGPYRSGQPSMLAMYISSYIPTLSSLIKARQGRICDAETRRFLAIGQAKPYDGTFEDLPFVEKELTLVGRMVPPAISFSRIDGANGTCDAAVQGLSNNHWIHVACHGIQNNADPYDSYLCLGDKPLKLLDIIQAHLAQAEFAFLSACHTAVGDDDSPDESIHLAAGLQFSGFRSVVGTIGPVDDNTVGCVVEEFYRRIFTGGTHHTNAAQALNRAVRISSKRGVPLDQRVIFIHLGA